MDADHQEDIEKLNAGFQEWESDYTDQERSMGFELLDPKDLTFTKFLGEGTSASVYVGELKGRGTVAIKVLRERIEEKLWQDFKKELKVMSLVRGPRIVEFYGVCMRPRFCIALEFCELGSLLHVLERQDIFWEWDKTFDLIRQVIQAVNDLHTWNPQIVHRDLKSLNLLLDKDFNVKVCDFGLARQTEVTEDADGQINTLSTLNKLRGTYGYSAPELYEKQKATNKSDVFSLGIILWEIVSRVITGVYARPYAEYTNMRYDFQILIGVSKKGIRPTLPATCPEEFKMMITSCWSGQAEKRPDCGFLLIQLNMIKGREYNKNKEQWDALLPPRPPGAITPGISSASSTAVPTVPEKNGNSGPESAATAKSAPATTSSTSTSTSPPAKASSPAPAPAPAPAQVPAPAVATTRKTRTSADKDGKEEKKEKKKKSSRKKEKKASSTTTEEGEKKKKKSSKKKEKADKDTGEKEKKKKKKKTTTKDAALSLSLSNSPASSPPVAARTARPMSAYAALPSALSPASSPPSSLPPSRSSSRPSSAYGCGSPLAALASPAALSLSAAELAASSTMLPPLTDDCAVAILRHLRPGELCRAALVAKSWHRLAAEDSLWAGFLTEKIRARRDPTLGGWKQYFKLAWRRSKVATEMLTTEQSYVGSLRRVVELFIVPLRDKGNEQVITAEERKALFSEIEVILGLNSSLLSELEERMAQWSFDQCLGDIFKQFTSFLKVYTSYINNFDNSITTLAKLKQSNANFSAYLSYAESRKECNGLQINSFLVMPVQRIPRYVLLLKDFLRHTPEDHDDHANVNKALADMQQVAAYIEKKKEEAENIYHIMAIQDSLVGKFNTIVVPGRKYKFEGALSEAVVSSKRTKRKTEGYYCFLFNDLFVVARRKGIISHIKKITAKRLRPGSKGSTWNNTALYSTPFGSPESTDGVKFDFVKQIPISATTTTIDRVSAEEAAEFGMEVDLCFKVVSAEDEEAEPPIFAAPNEKELSRWLQAFEGCISCMTPRSAETYIRIERSRSASTAEEPSAMKKKRNSASYGNAKKPSFLKRMSVGPSASSSLNIISPPSSPAVAPAASDRSAPSSDASSTSAEPAAGSGIKKKTKKDKKLKASA